MLVALSPAKVNLYLKVIGRRPDGYHDLCSVFQTISLSDRLKFKIRRDGRIILHCRHPGLPPAEDNLVVRAAEELKAHLIQSRHPQAERLGADIWLEKTIPLGSGLGGGSSNASATLRSLIKLWDIKGMEEGRLWDLAASLGSDVPYFLIRGTCLVAGRGEKVWPLTPLPALDMVVVYPDLHISTAWAYSRLSARLTKTSKCSKISMGRKFSQARGPESLAPLLENDLEAAVVGRYPEIVRLKEELLRYGALGSLMSGSGSSVFGIFPGRASARKAWRCLCLRWPHSFLVQGTPS